VPRNIIYSPLSTTPYSNWHRNCHDGVAMSDLDFVSMCPACAKPLLIGDTIYNNNQGFKGKSKFLQTPYTLFASELEIPYWEIYYTVDESKSERPITKIHAKRIVPYKEGIRELTPDNWLMFLEHLVLRHSVDCIRKDYLLERITKNESGNAFVRQKKYVKLLSE